MIAETDLAAVITAVAGLITAVAIPWLGYMTLRIGRTMRTEVAQPIREMVPKVTAIDRAVNGQPPGEETMVDKVTGIKDEQARVAEELAAPNPPTPDP